MKEGSTQPMKEQDTLPLEGIVEKTLERVMATLLKGKSHKGNPPYPPLSGGQEKSKPPQPVEGASPFYTLLTKGLFFHLLIGGRRLFIPP